MHGRVVLTFRRSGVDRPDDNSFIAAFTYSYNMYGMPLTVFLRNIGMSLCRTASSHILHTTLSPHLHSTTPTHHFHFQRLRTGTLLLPPWHLAIPTAATALLCLCLPSFSALLPPHTTPARLFPAAPAEQGDGSQSYHNLYSHNAYATCTNNCYMRISPCAYHWRTRLLAAINRQHDSGGSE